MISRKKDMFGRDLRLTGKHELVEKCGE